ncbi:hypothetical protein K2173_012663 [Erythroxylum novogranatense]|uniref:Phytanoyl-CoA dioxygenase n=1 Tax=Erythroxylum novogranatense TaxID=1862640 RepID=A0AAV8S6R9_9ROSI|nr:hypothetical protein K2173_012663 [Erythroxylum novogranatense]
MGIFGGLTDDQLNFFNARGYLVLESFASSQDTVSMIKRMERLVDDFDCSTASIFSTRNQQQATDNYFFESAEKISFFFEEKAFADDGNLKQSKELSINKVGHVVPHQDNSFLYTEPTTCTGLWLALEDAKVVNGCLWAIPGSHKNGLVRRFLRGEQGVYFDRPSPSYDQKDFVPIEVKAGSLVVIHGDLIHQSFENMSPKSRHAYSLHVVDTDGCKWAQDNWIRRKVEPEPLYVS